MITGELKSKIDSLWEIFWTGGLTNPLEVIEQMTYLMFIHDLDAADTLRAKECAMLGLPFEGIFADELQIGMQKNSTVSFCLLHCIENCIIIAIIV